MPTDYERNQKMLQQIIRKEREAESSLENTRQQANKEIQEAKAEAEEIIEKAREEADAQLKEHLEQVTSEFEEERGSSEATETDYARPEDQLERAADLLVRVVTGDQEE